jgi:DNA polymerase III subunit gamma/tau
MSLDTKYRPIKYSDVLGQKSSIKTLKGLVSNGAGWKQSYLFAGPFGSGKTTLGRILARALLCEKPVHGEPCDQCDSCLSMINGGSTNFIEVDAATNSGKADVKKILEELNYSSFAGNRKLYLFDEAHQLSRDALDALLKPMEENSKGSMDKRLVCIFATTEPEKMRQTVLSRCAPAFIIHHVKSDTIAERLTFVCEQEDLRWEDEALSLIADVSEGHIRDCLKAIEGVASSNDRYVSVEAVRAYLHVDRNDVVCKILLSDKTEAMGLCEELVSNTPIGIAYERLMTAAMFAVGLGMGTSNPPPYWNKEVLKRCFEKYEYGLLEFVDQISTRPRQGLTSALLKCDVLKWKMENFNDKIISHSTFQEQKALNTVEKVEQSQGKSVRLSVSAFTGRVNELMRTVQIEKKIEATTLGSH